MAERFAAYVLYYGVCFFEVALFLLLLRGGQWRRLCALFAYVASLVAIDAAGRSFVLHRYGLASRQYAYFFWLSDVILALAAFLLICALFRRACQHEAKMWQVLRLMLAFVFVLVLAISLFSLSRHYSHLFTRFIIEFEQNVYFTILVLNTLLYILIQQIQSADDELGLLVCGMGIQYAGPAAGWALVHLTPGQHFAQSLQNFLHPLSNLGMLLIWIYAVARVPKPAPVAASRAEAPALAEVDVPQV